MNALHALYQRYRRWEDGYIAMLDALDAGRPVDPAWPRTEYRRNVLLKCTRMTPGERAQLREFLWRYRGWRGFAWIGAVMAASCALGLLLHLALPGRFGAVESMVLISLLVFACGFALLTAWFSASSVAGMKPRSKVATFLATMGGALVGATMVATLSGEAPLEMVRRAGLSVVLAGAVVGGVFAVTMPLIAGVRNRELRALNARLAAEAERARLSKELAESRLRLLQAQIEPHFLFNTLGAVQQLAERGAPEAAALTGHLIHFLRSAIGSFRPEATTLEGELRLIEAYLEIMRMRLGDRLAFALDVPPGLRTTPMRPTLLITLVENAIKHGIEPHPPGGAITVTARRDADAIVIDVADTGAGMAELAGSGHGLTNVREQLRLAYGERGALELFDNAPQGVVARLRFPLE